MKKTILNLFLFLCGIALVSGILVLYASSLQCEICVCCDPENCEAECCNPEPTTTTETPTTTTPPTEPPTTTAAPTTPEPTTPEPTTPEPTTPEPTTPEPTTPEPTTPEPTTPEPTTPEPTTPEPTTAPPLRPRYWDSTTEEPEEFEEIEEPEVPKSALALKSVEDYVGNMTPEQKNSPDDIDRAMLFAEGKIAKYAAKKISGAEITINGNALEELQEQAEFIKELVENIFLEAGIETMREIRTGVTYETPESGSLTVKLKPSVSASGAENIIIQTPHYSVCIPEKVILSDFDGADLVITTERIISANSGAPMLQDFAYPSHMSRKIMLLGEKFAAEAKNEVQYKVTLSKDLKENIKYSFDPAPGGDVNYQAVFCSDGTPVGGKYNPLTKKIDVRIRFSDVYTVKANKKDFGDISKKSAQMQEAIRMLASKGIINGTGDNAFTPDGKITRAEITAMIVRTLISRFDENEDGKFTDVKKGDWYFGAIGTAKNYGIVKGVSETTFAPRNQIKKEQIIAIAARTLRSEMKYKTPKDMDKYLKKFTDRNALPDWGLEDFALASMADLIVPRTDGKFNPEGTMTRGEAAIVLYRLFMKIW